MEKPIAVTYVAAKKKINRKFVNFVNYILGSTMGIGMSLIPSLVFAHEPEPSFQELLHDWTMPVVLVASILITILVLLLLSSSLSSEKLKWTYFLSFVVVSLATTVYLAASTVYRNVSSETNGPVHWHAEYLVVACGEDLDLEDPSGLSNRIGTPLLHEHGDNWIHVEGVPLEKQDVSLHHYFESIGGELTHDHILYPTVTGPVYFRNGEQCPDQSIGTLQVFAYQTDGNTVRQTKLDDFENYVLAPRPQVPPGDCLVIEFGPEKEKTDLICPQYQLAIESGELEYVN